MSVGATSWFALPITKGRIEKACSNMMLLEYQFEERADFLACDKQGGKGNNPHP